MSKSVAVEKYSIIILCIPPFAALLFTIGVTFWFVPEWFRMYPGDLQDVTVPIIAASTVAIFPVQSFTSASMFRLCGTYQ